MSRASASAKPRKDLYTTKEVAQILGIRDPRRVKNYSDIEDYGIRPLHVGSGQGSRKLYSWTDLYRIALAERLAISGFTPFAIGRAIGEIRASEFNVDVEPSLSTPVLVGLGAKWKVMSRGEFRKLAADEQDSGVFVLNFQEVIADVVRAYASWENREDHENQ